MISISLFLSVASFSSVLGNTFPASFVNLPPASYYIKRKNLGMIFLIAAAILESGRLSFQQTLSCILSHHLK